MRRAAIFIAVGLTSFVAATAVSAQTISVGQSVNGELSSSDRRLGDGSYIDCYDLQTRAGQNLQIDQTAGLFDSFLSVMRGGCANPTDLIAQDDDGGGGLHSRIVQQGDGQLWAVVANSVEAGATGGYQLRVSIADGAGAAPAEPRGRSASTAVLPRVENEWGVEPLICHAAYASVVSMRARGVAPDEYGNLGAVDYADRATRLRSRLTADELAQVPTYAQNFEMMALVGAVGAAPNGTPNGHRPLAQYLTLLGDCDRANRFTPVTAY